MLSEKSLISNNTCSFGKWTHVVIVIAGPTIRLYLDGILDSSMYLNGPVYMPKECDMYIGRHKPATDIVGSSNDDNASSNDNASSSNDSICTLTPRRC